MGIGEIFARCLDYCEIVVVSITDVLHSSTSTVKPSSSNVASFMWQLSIYFWRR